MRKMISSLLGILIMLNTFGFNLVVIFMLQQSRAENLELIEAHPEAIASDNIVEFSLKNGNLRLINDHEVSCDNEMYDIIFKKDTGDDIILYCVSDKKDTRLHTAFKSLNDLSDNPLSVPDNFVTSILKNLLKNYLPPDGNNNEINTVSAELCLYTIQSVQSVIPEKIYPPPQIQIVNG